MPADTPMMKQYAEIKAQNPDCVLMFRLGDFYEMFGEDARLASKELDLVLTTRDKSAAEEEKVPMCGVPYHAAEGYIAKLIARGYKVAICEQTEDPKLAKGLVKRELIRIVTPGTAVDSAMLDERKNNYICSVSVDKNAGICFCDASTGEFYCTYLSGKDLAAVIRDEAGRFPPAEVLLDGRAAGLAGLKDYFSERLGCAVDITYDMTREAAAAILSGHFGEKLSSLGVEGMPETVSAAAALLSYLRATQKTDLAHIKKLELYGKDEYMNLGASSRQNLELTETLRTGDRKGSLLGVLDLTKTPMGARLLRSWIEKPLMNPAQISRRHSAVEELLNRAELRGELGGLLRGMGDIERIVGRMVYGSAGCRELRAMAETARRMPAVKTLLHDARASLLRELCEATDDLTDITELVDAAIVDEPPFSIREGGFIRDGFDPEVDKLRAILSGGRGGVAAIEAAERERTGIKNLKVGYNRVFGYYIEVRKTGYDQIPDDYIRKQTLSDRERYITEALKAAEETILTASDRLSALEYELFCEVRAKVTGEIARIQSTSQAISALDTLCAFAEAAFRYNYCRPLVDSSDVIEIRDGRHPVVERMLSDGLFVPNDTLMDCGENLAAIITGPNMAGKSTYMRQVAIIVLMAQAGSFVPARSARIGVVDRIFTRIGAADDLSAGQSTFMVEMTEVAEILGGATAKSLLILDEIGRGTSTFDGMAIARAVLEHVCDRKRIGAKTLFATHYHELTVLENRIKGVKNYNIAAKKRNKEIIFLRKIVPGGADDSYGVEVARLAGVPERVINRADELLHELEAEASMPVMRQASAENGVSSEYDAAPAYQAQMSLVDMGATEILHELRKLDPNTLTPIEALGLLFSLKKKADG